jgi:hypothetical protein
MQGMTARHSLSTVNYLLNYLVSYLLQPGTQSTIYNQKQIETKHCSAPLGLHTTHDTSDTTHNTRYKDYTLHTHDTQTTHTRYKDYTLQTIHLTPYICTGLLNLHTTNQLLTLEIGFQMRHVYYTHVKTFTCILRTMHLTLSDASSLHTRCATSTKTSAHV